MRGLEDDPASFWDGRCSGAFAVKLQVGIGYWQVLNRELLI